MPFRGPVDGRIRETPSTCPFLKGCQAHQSTLEAHSRERRGQKVFSPSSLMLAFCYDYDDDVGLAMMGNARECVTYVCLFLSVAPRDCTRMCVRQRNALAAHHTPAL